MVSYKSLEQQLKKINFTSRWGKAEVRELCNILMEDEEIEECVNGYYEAGFALLVATNYRLLLVDKKPMNYLTVEDMRFDLITDLDYSHRLIGAHLTVNTGGIKTLNFTSYNQQRLRRLVTFVQNRMTYIKKVVHQQQESQQAHLEQLNKQLHDYLLAAQRGESAPSANLPQPSQDYFGATGLYYAPQVTPQSMQSYENAAAAAIDLIEPEAPQPEIGLPPADQGSHFSQAFRQAEQIVLTPQQLAIKSVRKVVPLFAAYSRFKFVRRSASSSQSFLSGDQAAGTL